MAIKYLHSYANSRCEELRLIGDKIPHFVNAKMEPYRHVNSYIAHHANRWSIHSIRTCAENFASFLNWAESENVKLKSVKVWHIEHYMNALVAYRKPISRNTTNILEEAREPTPLQISTVVQRVEHICRFFTWLSNNYPSETVWNGNPSTVQSFSHHTRRYYNRTIVRSITGKYVAKDVRYLQLSNALIFIQELGKTSENSTFNNHSRNQLMAKVMLQIGLRVSEIVTLPEAWVSGIKIVPNFQMQLGRVVGKGSKIRCIEWPNKLLREVQEYCDFIRPLIVEDAQNSDPEYCAPAALFLTESGQQISTNWIDKLFQENSIATGIKCKPHWLRHTFGTYHYLIHQDLAHLADLMGHSDQETTREYYVATATLISKTGYFDDFQKQIDRDLDISFG